MTKFKRIDSLYNYLIIILILVAVAVRGGASFDWLVNADEPVYSIADINKVFADATVFEHEPDKSMSVYNQNNKLLGYVLVSEELEAQFHGYAGAVPLMIAFDANGTIIQTELLKHNETREFIEHVEDAGLLNAWNAQALDTALLAYEVDAVSGATKSSTAVIRTFQYTIGNYFKAEHQASGPSLIRIIQLALMAVIFMLSLNMLLGKRWRKYYVYHLVLVFLVMGLWLKKMLSLELLHNWLVKGVSWQSNWELIVILILSLILAISGHRKYYCTYLCPMGAMQMLVSKVSPFKKRNLKLKISVVNLRIIYLCFIWTSLILGFSLPLSNMEPFVAFSFKVASWIMLLAGALILLLSIFFNRPWCQLCPTGCLLDSIPSIKSNRKQ